MRRTYLNIILLLLPFYLFPFTPEEIEEYEKQSYELVNNDRATKAIYEGAIDELEKVFTDENLAILNAYELRLLRNMIFAQYGYSFTSQELQKWFEQFEWYEPLDIDVMQHFTWVDSMNINKIKLFESAHKGEKETSLKEDDLIGIWHASPMVAAGYSDLFYFFPDHTFKYSYNQMDWGKRVNDMSGNWMIKGNKLVLEVTQKTIIVGGEIVEGYASCASEFAIEGGKTETVNVSPAEILTFPITDLITHDLGLALEKTYKEITIGTGGFWKLYGDPYIELH